MPCECRNSTIRPRIDFRFVGADSRELSVHEALLDYTLDSVSGHGLLDALFCACMVL